MAGSIAVLDLISSDLTRVVVACIAVAALTVLGVAHPAAGTTPTAPTTAGMSGDLFNVAAEVAGVQYSVAQIAQNSSEVSAALALSPPSAPGSTITVQVTIGELVQMAHANLIAVSGIAQIADAAFPDLVAVLKSDQVGANVTTAVQDLQNAMGALVAYAEKPNVTKLDKFQSLLTSGVSAWNRAVVALSGNSAPTLGASTH
jgi:hypothetical protein